MEPIITFQLLLITMEKFCLKWNDFQSNVSNTFKVLRKEEDFFDVTLVSDDEQHIAAHKLVLSASSIFFKNILRKSQHSNPLIYLNGFSSKELNLMIEYIYNGEVQIYQNDLDQFLETAQKLKIEGLIGGSDENIEENVPYKEEFEEAIMEKEPTQETIEHPKKPRQNLKRTNTENTTTVVSQSSEIVDVKSAVDELVEKTGEGYKCKACGKISSSKTSSDIRRHAEIHIEGLAFDCQLCGQTFRCRNNLKSHIIYHHKHKKNI